MNTEELYEGIADIMQMDVADVKQQDAIFNESNLDSLAVISLIALVDEKCGVVLDGDALMKITSVSDLKTLIAQSQKN